MRLILTVLFSSRLIVWIDSLVFFPSGALLLDWSGSLVRAGTRALEASGGGRSRVFSPGGGKANGAGGGGYGWYVGWDEG